MKEKVFGAVLNRPRTVLFVALLVLLLTVGVAGEAAAHNPAGVAVPGCENGADAVVHENPNCHP